MIRFNRFVFLSIVLFALSVGSSKTSATSHEGSKCMLGDNTYLQVNGVARAIVSRAIAGDSSALDIVLARVRVNAEGLKPGAQQACQLSIWEDVAATYGNTNVAYEMASAINTEDFFWCNRSKHWAQVVLKHNTSLETSISGSKKNDIQLKEIDLRNRDMRRVLSKVCK